MRKRQPGATGGRTVHVLVRNESGRRCVLGVYRERQRARRAAREDRDAAPDLFGPNDYEIVALPLQD